MGTTSNSENLPLGTIVAFALSQQNIPNGWLFCDGSKIPSTYGDLINALGQDTTPNLCGRTLVSSGFSSFGTNFKLGDSDGAETHTLTVDEIPSHSHGYAYENPIGSQSSTYYSGNYWGPSTVKATTDTEGGGSAHTIMQPYYVVNYIIKAQS